MSDNKNKDKIDGLTFEAALEKLQEIVKNMETGKASLDQVVSDYEFGSALKLHCEKKLQEAKLKVEKITKNSADGSVSLEEFS